MNVYKSVFDQATQGITDDFEQMFEGLMDGSVNSFKSMTSSFLETFEKMIAQMAVLAIMNPVIVPVIEQLGSSFGISQTGIAALVQKMGGSPTGVASDALSTGSSLASFSGNALLPNGMSSGLDHIGNSVFGIGGKNLGIADSFGNADPAGSVGLGGQVSGLATFGNAAGGFAGGYLGNKVFGDTGIAGTLASGAGALGGAALATGGGALGTAIGTSLGSFAGPVGAAIGAFAATSTTWALLDQAEAGIDVCNAGSGRAWSSVRTAAP